VMATVFLCACVVSALLVPNRLSHAEAPSLEPALATVSEAS
jgi:hypothetical protein